MDTVLQLPARIDALPEYSDYADTGCDLYPSCLHCPLPKCRYDDPGGAPAMLRTGRDASILRLAAEDGVTVDGLAQMFGLSRRTIFRVLRTGRGREAAR
ncbi:MAG: helix-turn-helix domain-containing protein [Tepidiformaceae bacterium]